jgi:hypothetical protein
MAGYSREMACDGLVATAAALEIVSSLAVLAHLALEKNV